MACERMKRLNRPNVRSEAAAKVNELLRPNLHSNLTGCKADIPQGFHRFPDEVRPLRSHHRWTAAYKRQGGLGKAPL